MTRPWTRSRRERVTEDDAGDRYTSKPLESLDDDVASEPETEEPLEEPLAQYHVSDLETVEHLENLAQGAALPPSTGRLKCQITSLIHDKRAEPDIETEEHLEESLIHEDESDIETVESLENLAQGVAPRPNPGRLARQTKSLIRDKVPDLDIESKEHLEDSPVHDDKSDVETVESLESMAHEAAPPLSKRKPLPRKAPVARNKRLMLDDEADEALESPVQELAPTPSTHRSAHEQTPVAHKKRVKPDGAMPSPEAISAQVDAQLRGLRPVRKPAAARRRRMVRVLSTAESTTEPPSLSKRGMTKERQGQSTTRPAYQAGIQNVLAFLGETLRLTYKVTRTAFWIISPLVKVSAAVVLAIGLIGIMFWIMFQVLFPFGRSVLTASITSAYSPICHLPGIAVLPLPFCGRAEPVRQKATFNFNEMIVAQSKLGDVLQMAASAYDVPRHLRRTKGAVQELRAMIGYSSFQSKDKLLPQLDAFIKDSSSASDEIVSFNSHIGRIVDLVLLVTKYTEEKLESIVDRATSGGLMQVITDKVLAQLGVVKLTKEVVRDRFKQHTQQVVKEIDKVLEEGEKILDILKRLENSLHGVRNLVTEEYGKVIASKEEILFKLCEIIGANSKHRRGLDSRLELLGQVGKYRTEAYEHVKATMTRLQEIRDAVDDLKQRVAVPAPDLEFDLGIIASGLRILEAARSSDLAKSRERSRRG